MKVLDMLALNCGIMFEIDICQSSKDKERLIKWLIHLQQI